MATKDISDRDVCRAFDAYQNEGVAGDGKFPYDYLMEWTGEPMKVCWRAMERAESRGLVECGVSLRTGWLTDAGRAALKGIKDGQK